MNLRNYNITQLTEIFFKERKMAKTQKISASMEDYLEAIFLIASKKQAARAKDIANRLGVNNSSVTGALRILSEKGYINYAPYDLITLTADGKKLAMDVVRRHEVLRDFFIKVLSIDETEADEYACKMEHAVSNNILEKITRFIEFVEICPRGGDEWIKGFNKFCDQGTTFPNCGTSINICLEDLKKRKKKVAGKPQSPVILKDLNLGQRAKLIKVKGKGIISKRLAKLDITPGSIIEVERISPDSESIDIKVRGYHLSLREDEASKISVQIL